MRITRRQILSLASCHLFSRVLDASIPGLSAQPPFDVDRLLDASSPCDNAGCRPELRRYVANATVSLFSIPLISRSAVGGGYILIEEADAPAGHTLSIQFGAGSYPESARGLNRLGFIQEAVVEERSGQPFEYAWLAFMTTSQEKNIAQAKKALETSGAMVPYSASQGSGRNGYLAFRMDRLEFPARYTWRDIGQLVGRARAAMLPGARKEQYGPPSATERPATFLYQVRRAMLDPRPGTTGHLVFNGKQFQLDTQKEADTTATTHFSERKLISSAGRVMRMAATLTDQRSGAKTPFRLWYEDGAAHTPPLRFEYQARSFIRLTFETAAKLDTPSIRLAFKAPTRGGEFK